MLHPDRLEAGRHQVQERVFGERLGFVRSRARSEAREGLPERVPPLVLGFGYEQLELAAWTNWSVTYDLYILLKTIPAVLRRQGAY